MLRTFQKEIYTSLVLFTFSTLLTITKIICTVIILSWAETSTSTALKLWNQVNVFLDVSFLALKICRFPFIKLAREGQEADEGCCLQTAFILQATLYVIWQVPGNIWYWRCQDCFEDAAALTGLTLANLILAYFYMAVPALVFVSICACLPVAIIFVMMINGDTQRPASEDLIKKLKCEEYDVEKHVGENTCTICVSEYSSGESIVIMQCDPRHFFHTECIIKWLKINSICPICRAPYSLD
jgi:hypothetical protein